MTDDDIKALREALAAGPTPGPHVMSMYASQADCVSASKAWAAFQRACSPDRIARVVDLAERALTAEAEVERLRASLKPFADADLTSPGVRETFGFDVLRARAALAARKDAT